MNRRDLVTRMKGNTELSAAETDWFVRAFFDGLVLGLKGEGRVELRGFGVFSVSNRAQGDFVNPKDGTRVPGGMVKVVQFTPTARARSWEDVDFGG